MLRADDNCYAPFVFQESLLEEGDSSLSLSKEGMHKKRHIFTERKDNGWCGNGYDWEAIAIIVLEEQLSDLKEKLSFDSEADMFFARGQYGALKILGNALKEIYQNENELRNILGRAGEAP